MKAVIKEVPCKNNRMRADQLKDGQLAEVVGPIYTGDIVLRVYSMVVSLTNPDRTWSIPTPLQVEPFPRGTVVEITSEV